MSASILLEALLAGLLIGGPVCLCLVLAWDSIDNAREAARRAREDDEVALLESWLEVEA